MLVAVIKQFFILGCISFGGPAAHLGYFKKRFVDDLQWLSDKEYAQIVALSQFLPGPGSSQTGFAIGGVAPLGHIAETRVYIDEDLMRFAGIWAAAGSPNSVFATTPSDLVGATGATVLRMTG